MAETKLVRRKMRRKYDGSGECTTVSMTLVVPGASVCARATANVYNYTKRDRKSSSVAQWRIYALIDFGQIPIEFFIRCCFAKRLKRFTSNGEFRECHKWHCMAKLMLAVQYAACSFHEICHAAVLNSARNKFAPFTWMHCKRIHFRMFCSNNVTCHSNRTVRTFTILPKSEYVCVCARVRVCACVCVQSNGVYLCAPYTDEK